MDRCSGSPAADTGGVGRGVASPVALFPPVGGGFVALRGVRREWPAVAFHDRGVGSGTLSRDRVWVVVGGVQLVHTLIQRWGMSADGWRPCRTLTIP